MAGKLILLVEDSPDDAALALRALKQGGGEAEVVVARDGAEALDYLFTTPGAADPERTEPPSFVLLDLNLPKVDGIEVLRRIRSDTRTRLLPVVIFSSSNEERDIRTSYELGANSYVCKPVEFTEFRDVVQTVVHYWADLNQKPFIKTKGPRLDQGLD